MDNITILNPRNIYTHLILSSAVQAPNSPSPFPINVCLLSLSLFSLLNLHLHCLLLATTVLCPLISQIFECHSFICRFCYSQEVYRRFRILMLLLTMLSLRFVYVFYFQWFWMIFNGFSLFIFIFFKMGFLWFEIRYFWENDCEFVCVCVFSFVSFFFLWYIWLFEWLWWGLNC